jgi:hypothetical protein
VAPTSPFAHSNATNSMPGPADLCLRSGNQAGNEIGEQIVYHELRESFFGDDNNVLILRYGSRRIHARCVQSMFKSLAVFRCGEDDSAFGSANAEPMPFFLFIVRAPSGVDARNGVMGVSLGWMNPVSCQPLRGM